MATTETDSTQCIKFEKLLEFQKSLFIEELERHRYADEKADRYLTILIAVVGASAFLITKIRLDNIVGSFGWIQMTELSSLAFFYGSSFGALFLCLNSLRIRKYPAISLDPEMSNFFREHTYAQVLWSVSDRYREAAELARTENLRKFSSLRWASRLLVCSVVFGILTATFVLLELTPNAG